MKKKHVLFITSGLKPTAPNQITAAVIRASEKNYTTHWFAFDKITSKDFFGVEATKINGGRKGFSYFTFFKYLLNMKPAVAHISLAKAALIALPLIKVLSPDTKIIYVNHGLHELHERFSWLNWAVTKAFITTLTLSEKIINVSDYTKTVLLSHSDFSDKCLTIHNGVNLRKYYPYSKALRDSIFSNYFPGTNPHETFLIGNAANLISLKGHANVIKALPYVLSSGYDVKYIIWGDGPEKKALQTLCDELNLRSSVAFPGHVNNLEKLYPCLDLYIQSSYEESFGMSVIEAMACQIPVIVSKVGGLNEIIISSKVGWKYPSESITSLAAQITDALSHKGFRDTKAKDGRLHVLEFFSEQKMVSRYLTLMSDVLDNK